MNTPRIYLAALLGLAPTATTLSGAQPEKSAPSAKKEKSVHFDKPQAPATLPGKGLAQHDFILMGVRSSSDGKGIRMVKGGQVVWSYVDPEVKGAYYAATLLPNGNLLLAHGRGVRLITPDKKVLWKYEVDPNEHEIDGAEMVGTDRVVFLSNGNPTAKIIVANIVTGKIEKEVEVPLAATANMKEPRYVHMQARAFAGAGDADGGTVVAVVGIIGRRDHGEAVRAEAHEDDDENIATLCAGIALRAQHDAHAGRKRRGGEEAGTNARSNQCAAGEFHAVTSGQIRARSR